MHSNLTRRQALTAGAAGAAAIGLAAAPTAAAPADPHARIEALAAELVDCLREIAGPDAFRVQFLLNARTDGWWRIGADEYFIQREVDPRMKAGYIDVEWSRPIVREGCWGKGA